MRRVATPVEGVVLAAAEALTQAGELRTSPVPELAANLVEYADDPDYRAGVALTAGGLRYVADLITAARAELVSLWADFANQRHAAYTGWSVGCEGVAYRIAELTILLGPCRWEDVQEGPLRDGTYRALHHALGLDPGIDEDVLAEFLATRDRAANIG